MGTPAAAGSERLQAASQRVDDTLTMQRLAEAGRGEFDLRQLDLRAIRDQERNPTRRRALVTLRVVPVEQAEGQRVPELTVRRSRAAASAIVALPVSSARRNRA